MAKTEVIEKGHFRIVFDRQSAGFPACMSVSTAHGWETVVDSSQPWLKITLSDGTQAYPVWPDDYDPVRTSAGCAQRLDFRNLPWQTPDGTILKGFSLTMRYEFRPDGAVFVNTFFLAENTEPQALRHFTLTVPMTFPDRDDVRWGYWERPDKEAHGDLIQSLRGVKRYLMAGDDHQVDDMVLPLVGFDFGFKHRPAKHLEWILDGFNSLAPDFTNTATSISWKGNTAQLTWEFLKEERSTNRPWQWRNQWGWVLSQSPQKRRHAPMRMYHYLDTCKRYPTNKQIEKMARHGADMLVLHECWQLDPQNSRWPYSTQETMRVVTKAHELGLRVVLYMRGEEITAREEACDWFDEFLQKDFDGLYMDFGTPICQQSVDERSPGGRILFREYYLMVKRLRDRVGEKGVLLAHSGPFFSACGTAGLIDGYVAGEGEKGIMLKDRTAHTYFSAIGVAPPTMWTAAFPDYSSRKAIPFMASVAQIPHVSLGVQLESSSLAHPSEPGNVTYIRPLWKLWGLFKTESNIIVLHDYNTEDVFSYSSDKTAACVLQAQDGTLLVIASNFSDRQQNLQINIDWGKAGLQAPGESMNVMQLNSEAEEPKVEPYSQTAKFAATLRDYGVMGWIIYLDSEKWRQRLDQFARPYPEMDDDERQYVKQIEDSRSLRFEPKAMKHAYMQLTVQDYAIAWEDSIYWDLYDNWNELYLCDEDGSRKLLGYVSCKGVTPQKPDKKDHIWPGHKTPWIALHKLLSKGRHELAIKTKHHGEDFYSFVIATITSDPEKGTDAYEVRFANELDPDRSELRFGIWIE